MKDQTVKDLLREAAGLKPIDQAQPEQTKPDPYIRPTYFSADGATYPTLDVPPVETFTRFVRAPKLPDLDRSHPDFGLPVVVDESIPDNTLVMVAHQYDDQGRHKPVILGVIKNVGL